MSGHIWYVHKFGICWMMLDDLGVPCFWDAHISSARSAFLFLWFQIPCIFLGIHRLIDFLPFGKQNPLGPTGSIITKIPWGPRITFCSHFGSQKSRPTLGCGLTPLGCLSFGGTGDSATRLREKPGYLGAQRRFHHFFNPSLWHQPGKPSCSSLKAS